MTRTRKIFPIDSLIEDKRQILKKYDSDVRIIRIIPSKRQMKFAIETPEF